MDQICPILYDNWEIECHTDPVPFKNSYGMAKNVKIPIENFSYFNDAPLTRLFVKIQNTEKWTITKIFLFWVFLLIISVSIHRNNGTLFFVFFSDDDAGKWQLTALSNLNYFLSHFTVRALLLQPLFNFLTKDFLKVVY